MDLDCLLRLLHGRDVRLQLLDLALHLLRLHDDPFRLGFLRLQDLRCSIHVRDLFVTDLCVGLRRVEAAPPPEAVSLTSSIVSLCCRPHVPPCRDEKNAIRPEHGVQHPRVACDLSFICLRQGLVDVLDGDLILRDAAKQLSAGAMMMRTAQPRFMSKDGSP